MTPADYFIQLFNPTRYLTEDGQVVLDGVDAHGFATPCAAAQFAIDHGHPPADFIVVQEHHLVRR